MWENLHGLRIFVVEDEQLIVMLLEDMLADLGATMAAQAGYLSEALKVAEVGNFDVAILDLNLGGTKVFPVAEALAVKGKPFVFASGYGATGIPAEFSAHPVVAKPYQLEEIAAALEKICPVKRLDR